jgi:flagellar basal-body rod protein FlgG
MFQFNGVPENITPSAGVILQGRLESGNVSVAGSAVRMVTVMRQFEMLQKAILIGADMNTAAIQSVSKSGA